MGHERGNRKEEKRVWVCLKERKGEMERKRRVCDCF